MPKKVYTPSQSAALAAVANYHTNRMIRAAQIEKEVRDAVAKEMLLAELEESRLANRAVDGGVTKTDVRVALGIGNWDTFKGILAKTQTGTHAIPEFEVIDGVVTVNRAMFDGEEYEGPTPVTAGIPQPNDTTDIAVAFWRAFNANKDDPEVIAFVDRYSNV